MGYFYSARFFKRDPPKRPFKMSIKLDISKVVFYLARLFLPCEVKVKNNLERFSGKSQSFIVVSFRDLGGIISWKEGKEVTQIDFCGGFSGHGRGVPNGPFLGISHGLALA